MDNPLPRYLYRVYDEKSHSQFDRDLGFVASIHNAVCNTEHQNAGHELEQHTNLGYQLPTPFLSVTSSRAKALESALQRVDMGRRTVSIAKIDSSQLKRADVKLMDGYVRPAATNKYEYMCHCIPAIAVIEYLTLDGDDED